MDPHSKFGLDGKMTMPHIHRDGMKMFITDIMGLSGEFRAGPQAGPKWLERTRKGDQSDFSW